MHLVFLRCPRLAEARIQGSLPDRPHTDHVPSRDALAGRPARSWCHQSECASILCCQGTLNLLPSQGPTAGAAGCATRRNTPMVPRPQGSQSTLTTSQQVAEQPCSSLCPVSTPVASAGEAAWRRLTTGAVAAAPTRPLLTQPSKQLPAQLGCSNGRSSTMGSASLEPTPPSTHSSWRLGGLARVMLPPALLLARRRPTHSLCGGPWKYLRRRRAC